MSGAVTNPGFEGGWVAVTAVNERAGCPAGEKELRFPFVPPPPPPPLIGCGPAAGLCCCCCRGYGGAAVGPNANAKAQAQEAGEESESLV